MISLSLNSIDIDWGKNRYWRAHHWLFPPGSLTDVDYVYADDVTVRKPGFETSLAEALFRMRHLGFSAHETRVKFDEAVTSWNRTADLQLTFDDLRSALLGIDFQSLTPDSLIPFEYDFRNLLLSLLTDFDTDEALLEDFIAGLDVPITLRVIADNRANLDLRLRWHHQDLIDGGWASIDDLTEIDRRDYIINHTMLVGRLQDHAGTLTVSAFDTWLASRGVRQSTAYTRVKADGSGITEALTLPGAVRNMIHHPENPHNVLTDAALSESLEILLDVTRSLPDPLPGLA